jgi:hypothetical protein
MRAPFCPSLFLETAMRKPSTTILLSVLLAFSWVGFLVINSGVAQQGGVSNPQWRYRATTQQDLLESLGEDGWEAYAVTDSETSAVRYFLKKRIQ